MENIIVSAQANVLIRRISGSIGETHRQALADTKQYLFFLKGLGRAITQDQQLDYLALSLLLEARRNTALQEKLVKQLEQANQLVRQARHPSTEVEGRIYTYDEMMRLATSVIVLEDWSPDIHPRPTKNLARFIVEIEKAERKKSYQRGLQEGRRATAEKNYNDSLWWLWLSVGVIISTLIAKFS